MNIKTKLRLGIGLLFLMILLLSTVGIRNVNSLKNDTENILADNYNTLEYCQNMIAALDVMQQKQNGLPAFEKNLRLQTKNVTEPGEGQATAHISQRLGQLRSNPGDPNLHLSIRRDIAQIMEQNMKAIERKSDIATQTAKTANTWIMISSTLCFLFGMTLLVNLPETLPTPSGADGKYQGNCFEKLFAAGVLPWKK